MANISIETKKFTQLPTTQSLTDSSLMLARDVAGVKTIQFSDLRAQLQGQTYVQEIKSKNILDSSKLEQGNISESTGAEVTSTNRVRTGFIPVEASETYTASVGNSKVLVFAFLYDSSKAYLDYKILSGEGATSPTFTVSASTAYVRITVKNSDDSTIVPANVSNFQLELGDTATPYVPFSLDTVGLTNRRFVQDWESKNILCWAKMEQGGIDAGGNDFSAVTYIRSDYTPIKSGHTYKLSFKTALSTEDVLVWFYDSSKTMVGNFIGITGSNYIFTVPSGVTYARIRFTKNESDPIDINSFYDVQLEEGTEATQYVPFAETNENISTRTIDIETDTVYKGIQYKPTGAYTSMSMGFGTMTISDFIYSLRTTRGAKQGSVNISNSTTVCPDGWYHYEFVPHRTGGLDGDNSQYLLLRLTSFFNGFQYELSFTASGSAVTLQTLVLRKSNLGAIEFNTIPNSGTLTYPMGFQPYQYGCYLVLGYVANIGPVFLRITINASSVYVYDMLSNSAFSNTHFSVALSSDNQSLLFTTDSTTNAKLVFIGG